MMPTRSAWQRCATHGRDRGHYLLGVVLHALLFALIGPAIGGLVVSCGFLPVAPVTIFCAYIKFTGAAAIAGGAVALITSFVEAPRKLYGLSALIGTLSAVSQVIQTPQADIVLFSMVGVPGAIASVTCTYIARPLRLVRGNPFFAPEARSDRERP